MKPQIFIRHQNGFSGPFPPEKLRFLISSPSWSPEHRWTKDGFQWHSDLSAMDEVFDKAEMSDLVDDGSKSSKIALGAKVVGESLGEISRQLTALSESGFSGGDLEAPVKELERIDPTAPPKCLCCGSSNVQRCEMIFNSGVTMSSGTSRSVGIGVGSGGSIGVGIAGGSSSSVAMTNLAQIAAPPAKKTLKYWVLMSIVCFMLSMNSLSIGYSGVILMVPFLLMSAVGVFFVLRTMNYNKHDHKILYREWSRTWMCLQCGGSFRR